MGVRLQGSGSLPLKNGPIGCSETSATINQRCVTSRKSKDLNKECVWKAYGVALPLLYNRVACMVSSCDDDSKDE